MYFHKLAHAATRKFLVHSMLVANIFDSFCNFEKLVGWLLVTHSPNHEHYEVESISDRGTLPQKNLLCSPFYIKILTF